MSAIEGGCHCRAVRYRIDGEPMHTSLCHCPDCRRAAGAPVVAWAMFPTEALKVTHGAPKKRASSPGVERHFCADCGTGLFYFAAEMLPGLVDVTIASFDEPARSPPAVHIWNRHRLPWLSKIDALPAFDELPPMS